MNTKNIEQVIQYILASEREDYMDWCKDNELDHLDHPNNNHVYAHAVLSLLEVDKLEQNRAIALEDLNNLINELNRIKKSLWI